MSEYQYYEFQAIDRPLGQKEMAELRALSTRARITPTSFVNEYHWGDFRGDPDRLIKKYFDVFFYFANWGTRRLAFRLPRTMIDEEAARSYCAGNSMTLRTAAKFAVLNFQSNQEGEDWQEDPGTLASLIPLRADLMAGDLRCLYLGWLLAAEGQLEEEDIEPPVPAGLGSPSASLSALADFFAIDPDLIEAAAKESPAPRPADSAEELQGWVAALPEPEKDAWLLRLAREQTASLGPEFLRSLRRSCGAADRSRPKAPRAGRTVGQLLAARDEITRQRRRRQAQERAEKQTRLAREAAAARAARLDTLAGRQEEAWRRIDALIATKKPKAYDEAVSLLKDLRDLADRAGLPDRFGCRFLPLRRQHASKGSLQRRFRDAGLPPCDSGTEHSTGK